MCFEREGLCGDPVPISNPTASRRRRWISITFSVPDDSDASRSLRLFPGFGRVRPSCFDFPFDASESSSTRLSVVNRNSRSLSASVYERGELKQVSSVHGPRNIGVDEPRLERECNSNRIKSSSIDGPNGAHVQMFCSSTDSSTSATTDHHAIATTLGPSRPSLHCLRLLALFNISHCSTSATAGKRGAVERPYRCSCVHI